MKSISMQHLTSIHQRSAQISKWVTCGVFTFNRETHPVFIQKWGVQVTSIHIHLLELKVMLHDEIQQDT